MQNCVQLSIIIVHYKTPEMLKLCLRSVKDTINNLTYEVIVVDHASTRESRDTILGVEKTFDYFKFLPNKKNPGYSHGVNSGLKEATGEYMLILNPDIIVGDNAIEHMRAYMISHPDIGMLGPRLLNFNGTYQQSYFRFYKPLTIVARRSSLALHFEPVKQTLDEFLMKDSDPAKIQAPDWLMGSALMISRQALEIVGFMDERFFMYFEDVDWARRFWHNGYKVIYYPEAVMYHYHQRESKTRLGLFDALFNTKARWHIQSAVKFFWKWRPSRLAKSAVEPARTSKLAL